MGMGERGTAGRLRWRAAKSRDLHDQRLRRDVAAHSVVQLPPLYRQPQSAKSPKFIQV